MVHSDLKWVAVKERGAAMTNLPSEVGWEELQKGIVEIELGQIQQLCEAIWQPKKTVKSLMLTPKLLWK